MSPPRRRTADAPPPAPTIAQIDKTCVAFDEAERMREGPRTLYFGGTRGMREAGERFLPKEPSERDRGKEHKYLARLNRSVLFPMLSRAVKSLAGRVFSDPIGFGEGTSPLFVEWSENIDLAGRTLERFLYDAFVIALVEDESLIMVDYPPPATVRDPNGTERPLSPAEERAAGRRPFWTLYSASQMFNFRSTVESGRWRLLEARFRLCENEPADYGEVKRHYVRRYVAGTGAQGAADEFARWELWVKIDSGPDAGKYQLTDRGGSLRPHVDIPLVAVYTERVGFFEATPPLLDLADLNVSHWQKQSDLDNGLHVSAFPMWHRSGVQKGQSGDDTVEVGWGKFFNSTPEGASMSVIESSGSVYGVLEKNLDRVEERARLLAMEPMRPANGLTATSDVIRSDEALCKLQAYALQLQQSANAALALTAKWVDVESLGSIDVPHRFRPVEATPADLQALQALRAGTPDGGPDLSRRRLLTRLADVGTLGSDFDFEANEAELAEEARLREEGEVERQVEVEKAMAQFTPKPEPAVEEADEVEEEPEETGEIDEEGGVAR